jgi:hypothetical protein
MHFTNRSLKVETCGSRRVQSSRLRHRRVLVILRHEGGGQSISEMEQDIRILVTASAKVMVFFYFKNIICLTVPVLRHSGLSASVFPRGNIRIRVLWSLNFRIPNEHYDLPCVQWCEWQSKSIVFRRDIYYCPRFRLRTHRSWGHSTRVQSIRVHSNSSSESSHNIHGWKAGQTSS